MYFLINVPPPFPEQSILVPFNDTGAELLVAVLTSSPVLPSCCVTFSKKLPSVVGGEVSIIKTVCKLFPFILHLTDPSVTQVNTNLSPGHTIGGDCSYDVITSGRDISDIVIH